MLFTAVLTATVAVAQESINAQEGVDIVKNAGIALAICFSILSVLIFVINLISSKGFTKKKYF